MWDNKHIQVSDWLNQNSRGKVSYSERITLKKEKNKENDKISS